MRNLTTLLPLLLLAAVATQGADGATQTRATRAPVKTRYAMWPPPPHAREREREVEESAADLQPAHDTCHAPRAACRLPPAACRRRARTNPRATKRSYTTCMLTAQ